MGNEAGPDTKTAFEELANNATLEVLVPRSADIDYEAVLREKSQDGLSRLEARREFFFDENVSLALILKAHTSEDNLRSLLSNLEISVSAHASESAPQGNGNGAAASAKHDLASKTLRAGEPETVITANDYVYAVWRPAIHLARPRVRLQRPAVYYTASLTVVAAALTAAQRSKEQYLTSYETLPRNVLEPLQFDPALRDSDIQLSETRVTKVAPASADARADIVPVRGASKRVFPISPVLYTKIRYSTLSDGVVASLHIETAMTGSHKVVINNIRLSVPDAIVDDLSKVALPHATLGGDEIVVLHKLRRKPGTTEADRSLVTVNIEAKASPEEDIEVPLTITWQAHVNLSQTKPKSLYRWSRPSGLSKQPSSRSVLQATFPTATNENSSQTTAPDASSVIFNFTATPTTTQGEEFQLSVQCISRSSRARSFVLVGLQPKNSSAKAQPASNAAQVKSSKDLLNAPFAERSRAPNVTDLNPDLRIGPLSAGACYETSMRFCALASGLLDLGGARIIDLDTRQTIDVRSLPDVVAVDAAA